MPRRAPFIGPPWGGWDDSQPSIVLPNNSFKQITNWLISKGGICAFPQLQNFTMPNDVPLGLKTFVDGAGALHTVMLGAARGYYLNPSGLSWDLIGTLPTPMTNNIWAMQVYQNKLYFSGGSQILSYISGDSNIYTAGDVQGGCQYLGKFDGKLIMVNTFENQVNNPRRLRWCALNNANEWDPTIDFTAGAVDLSDVEDYLTGWSTISPYGYAYRQMGISVVSPTGNGANPFFIENYSIGDAGIGNFTPYTLDTFGTFSVFRGWNDIYRMDPGSAPQPIGGKAKRSILNDLDNNNFGFGAFGKLIGGFGGGIDYLSYWLCIPISNSVTSTWIYHFDDGTWINTQLAFGQVTSMGYVAVI